MSLKKRSAFLTGTATMFALAGASFAGDGAGNPDVDGRIASLERELAQLKSEQQSSANWMSPDRAEEVRAMINDVVADSARRTSLLAANGNAGWNNGFYIQSDDGAFTMNIHALAQFRAIWNMRDMSGGDDSIFGFENNRTRFWADGNLFGEDFTYLIKGDFMSGGTFTLLDCYGQYQMNEEWWVRWGQFKDPFTAEFQFDPGRLQTVDYSWLDSLVGTGYVQGVMAGWESDNFRVSGAFSDGSAMSVFGPNGGGANAPAMAGGGNEFAVSARGDFIVAGDTDWSRFSDMESWAGEEYTTKVGGGLHWQDGEYGSGVVPIETAYFGWTADAHVELGGASVFGAVSGLSSDTNLAGATDFDQLGFLVQGGIFLTEDELEAFGRYEFYDFDGAVAGDDTINLVTLGVNWFWEGHSKKWTTDVLWGLDGIPGSAANPGIGLMGDAANQEDQFALRSQVTFSW